MLSISKILLKSRVKPSIINSTITKCKSGINTNTIYNEQSSNSTINNNVQNTRTFATTSPQSVPLSQLSENFLDGTSANYVDQMYTAWKQDPSSVHTSWNAYFTNVENNLPADKAFTLPPTISGKHVTFNPSSISSSQTVNESQVNQISQKATESMRLLNLVNAYQVYGHHAAKLDPLEMVKVDIPLQLQLESYGFTESDLDREFYLGQQHFSGFLASDRPKTKLRDLIKRLEQTYCNTIGVEYMHIQNAEKINWIREKFETPIPYSFKPDEKVVILDRLAWATKLEKFIGVKWQVKRFGVDGCETLIPGLKALIDASADLGVEHIVFGMAHRGRLNVLANVVRKPVAAIFHEFAGGSVMEDDFYTGSGDVKYHLGTSFLRPTRNGKSIHLSLLANPSHLDAVNPVVEGKARATQYYKKDLKHEKVMSLQLHGDAAFAGQGIVYETFGLSTLPNYTTGGTIHIIVNNQIGFTTDPSSARGTRYCTDIAKAAGVPVFHVNADDAEAVVHVFQIAAEWRQKFHRDIVIDLIGYRRFGHNESDEPRHTQPQMYKKIDQQKPSLDKYREQLQTSKVLTESQYKEIDDKIQAELERAHTESLSYKPSKNDWLESVWKGFSDKKQIKPRSTSVPMETLKHVGSVLSSFPSKFKIHPVLKKALAGRKVMIDSGEKLDWAMGEMLAYGTLLLEGTHVRLSGQDVERGTFSHRHAVIHDQESLEVYTPLNNLGKPQEKFTISNSNLSEYGVLGFELGYSLTHPNCLVLWEAQFGDFSNGAQIIIDQFLSSGESKWKRQSGLVMLLPHGYDGMGPEHSSARLERYLALCDADPDVVPTDIDEKVIQSTNMQVCNITSPANYFHVLRRQVHRGFRKPLVVMTPKNLLRHRLASSSLKEFSDDTGFQTLIPETSDLTKDDKVRKVVFCTGKVSIDLMEERQKRNISDVAIIRVEQLHPFPFAKVTEQIKKYNNAQVIWCQEEPKNMGAWSWIGPHIRTAGREKGASFYPTYVGRPAAASPATGLGSTHTAQYETMIENVFKAEESKQTKTNTDVKSELPPQVTGESTKTSKKDKTK